MISNKSKANLQPFNFQKIPKFNGSNITNPISKLRIKLPLKNIALFFFSLPFMIIIICFGTSYYNLQIHFKVLGNKFERVFFKYLYIYILNILIYFLYYIFVLV